MAEAGDIRITNSKGVAATAADVPALINLHKATLTVIRGQIRELEV